MSMTVDRSGNELIDIWEPWLYQHLAADAKVTELSAGNIVGHLSPGEIDGSYVWFEPAFSRDRLISGAQRIWADADYEIVAAAATSSWVDVAPLAGAMMDILDVAPGTVIQTEHGNLEFWRTAPLQYAQTIQGVQYRFLGGRFHVRAYYT